ncbi:MAG: hypothetical protein JRJ82_18395 [Deltaproteobacteria bacterium]|nr:hypothetical protein [Deltaproteobacteria bacterium]
MKKFNLLWLTLVFGLICSVTVPGPLSLAEAADEYRKGEGKEYTVESSVDDDTFVINGHVFKAKSFCLNVLQGDRVVFVEGRADGYGLKATFVNVRTGERCEVLCEGR